MSNPSISVALCTYNGERFLGEQLRSMAAQDHLPDELVACDDGSSDTTISQLETFARTAPFAVRIVRNPRNLGSNGNFEQAIRLCGGDILFLSDQDDIWLPNKVSVTASWFHEHPEAEAVFSDGDIIDERSQPDGHTLWQSFWFDETRQRLAQREGFHRFLQHTWCVTGAALAFRKRLCARVLPFPTHLPLFFHDAWIGRVASVTGQLYSLPERLILYRKHPAQQVGFGTAIHAQEKAASSLLTRRESLAKASREANAVYEELKIRCGGDCERLESYRRAAAHARHRDKLPAFRPARWPLILREFLNGGYQPRGVGALKRALGDTLL